MVRRDLGLNRRGFLQAVGLAGIAAAQPAFAQLFVNIQGVGANQFPIAIQPFFGNSEAPENIAEIIGNDLVRSGFFRLVSCDAATALDKDPDWKALGTAGVGAFADGSVTRAADGRYEIKFRLFDPVKKQETDEASYISPKDDLRLYAHKIADRIFERLTGEKGDFATRIAYVSQQGKNNYAIMVADSDGYNPQVALRIRHPIISIDWSPNGRQIAYTSFETGKPTVWIHDLSTANVVRSLLSAATTVRRPLALTAARWPWLCRRTAARRFICWIPTDRISDSSRRAAVLIQSPHSRRTANIFTSQATAAAIRRFTESRLPGGSAERISFGNAYAISPAVSPKNDQVAYIVRTGGHFKLVQQDLATGNVIPLSEIGKNESPSYSPERQHDYLCLRGWR